MANNMVANTGSIRQQLDASSATVSKPSSAVSPFEPTVTTRNDILGGSGATGRRAGTLVALQAFGWGTLLCAIGTGSLIWGARSFLDIYTVCTDYKSSSIDMLDS